MNTIIDEINPNPDIETAFTVDDLNNDLDRTLLQGESDEQRQSSHKSPQRLLFQDFWSKYNACEEDEKLKYQQGIADGGYISNYIGTYASQVSGFDEDPTDELRIDRFQSIKKSFEVHRFAYPRKDGTWGGFCMIKQVVTHEWVICNTSIKFNTENGKNIIKGEARIFGRGQLFEHISGKIRGTKCVTATDQLQRIFDNPYITQKIINFSNLDAKKIPSKPKWWQSKDVQSVNYDLLTPNFFKNLRMPPQLSPNCASEFPGEAAAAESEDRVTPRR